MTKPVLDIDDLSAEPVARMVDIMAWGTELRHIITEFKDGDKFPLSDTEINDLVNIIHAKIELLEELITEDEYTEKLKRM